MSKELADAYDVEAVEMLCAAVGIKDDVVKKETGKLKEK